jgi:hypothetical protein
MRALDNQAFRKPLKASDPAGQFERVRHVNNSSVWSLKKDT